MLFGTNKFPEVIQLSENNNMYDNNGCDNIYGSYRQTGSYQPGDSGGYNPSAGSYGNNPYAGRPNNSNPYNANPYNSRPYNSNPYGYNNPYNGNPYAYNPYMYTPPRKKSFSERFNAYFRKKPYSGLAALAGFSSLGIMLYLGLSAVLGGLIVLLTSVSPALFDGEAGFAVLGMLSSVMCVGLPFIIIYGIMNRYENTSFRIPFTRPRKGSNWGLLIVAGLGLCYLGNIITGYFTAIFQAFGIDFASTELSESISSSHETPLGFVLTLIYVAVCPAIFEEIAFRGVILQPLRKYGDWFAIIVSSVIFGLVHGNMTQMPFAIIVGVALGYTYVVTGSIIPSMIIHFLNNGLSLVYSTVLSGLSEEKMLIFSSVFVYGLVFIGFVAFFAYKKTNRYYRHLRKGDYPEIGTKRKAGTYFLMPSMLAAVIILVFQVLSDIMVGALM